MNASESSHQVEVEYVARKSPKIAFGDASDISFHEGRLKFMIPPRSGVVLK